MSIIRNLFRRSRPDDDETFRELNDKIAQRYVTIQDGFLDDARFDHLTDEAIYGALNHIQADIEVAVSDTMKEHLKKIKTDLNDVLYTRKRRLELEAERFARETARQKHIESDPLFTEEDEKIAAALASVALLGMVVGTALMIDYADNRD